MRFDFKKQHKQAVRFTRSNQSWAWRLLWVIHTLEPTRPQCRTFVCFNFNIHWVGLQIKEASLIKNSTFTAIYLLLYQCESLKWYVSIVQISLKLRSIPVDVLHYSSTSRSFWNIVGISTKSTCCSTVHVSKMRTCIDTIISASYMNLFNITTILDTQTSKKSP